VTRSEAVVFCQELGMPFTVGAGPWLRRMEAWSVARGLKGFEKVRVVVVDNAAAETLLRVGSGSVTPWGPKEERTAGRARRMAARVARGVVRRVVR
jgi:hypothetical protein